MLVFYVLSYAHVAHINELYISNANSDIANSYSTYVCVFGT